MSIQQPARARAATDTPEGALYDERVANTPNAAAASERILRPQGASAVFGGNAVEDEEAEQGRDRAGRKAQHERACDEQQERGQKTQAQNTQGHAGERQDVPGAAAQLVGERRVAERACEHAGGHGRQHVAEQLGLLRGGEVHRQDEALERTHHHDHAEADEHGRAQKRVAREQHAHPVAQGAPCAGQKAALWLRARSADARGGRASGGSCRAADGAEGAGQREGEKRRGKRHGGREPQGVHASHRAHEEGGQGRADNDHEGIEGLGEAMNFLQAVPSSRSQTAGTRESRAVMPGMSPMAPKRPRATNQPKDRPHTISTTGSRATLAAERMSETMRRCGG